MQPEQPEADKLAALIDSVRALEAAGIRYALIGGLAVGVHAGVPRATLDINFAVHLSKGREKAVQALEAAGSPRLATWTGSPLAWRKFTLCANSTPNSTP